MLACTDNQEVSPATDAVHRDSDRVLMRVTGLRKAFGGQVVLNGVDLELREGEVILLRGENGSGKTTLLNILTGNMEPDAGYIELFVNSHPERFRFPRHWWQELNPWYHFTPERVATEGVGRTWQDTRLFGSHTLVDNLAVARPEQPGEKPWRVLTRPSQWQKAETKNRQDVMALLQALGLGDRGDSSADMISLGQTKRIAFARSVHANKKIIFLDEPLAGLDQKGTESIISVLRDLAAAHSITLVIVEHVFNIPIILDFATAVWTLAEGRLTQETIEEARLDPTVQRTSAMPAIVQQMALLSSTITEENLPGGAVLTRILPAGTTPEPLLILSNLVVRRGNRIVVGKDENGSAPGISLTINKGETVFLQAPNGWGKTSLLESIAGVIPCESGDIQLNGKSLLNQAAWDRKLNGLSVVPARDGGFNSLRVKDYQRLALGPLGNKHTATPALDLETRLMSSLSGGELKRISIETALAKDATVRIWDEPFASLDLEAASYLYQHLAPDKTSASLIMIPVKHIDPTLASTRHLKNQPTSRNKAMSDPTIPEHTRTLISSLTELSRSGTYLDSSIQRFRIFSGMQLEIWPSVSPILPSSHCYLSYLSPTIIAEKHVLDHGCGSGVLAIAAALLGAKHVDAIDISTAAVECTTANAKAMRLSDVISTRQSDGFVSVTKKYDLILANLPIVRVENSPPECHFGMLDLRFSVHDAFLRDFRRCLLPGGAAFVCHAPLQDEWGFDAFERYLTSRAVTYHCAHEFQQHGLSWRLYSVK